MINNDWDNILKEEIKKEYFKNILTFLENQTNIIYPKKENIFKALELTTYKKTKVVILGQDPYHGENEANGLCFSVNKGMKIPPSLKNIFKELESDLNIKRENPDLSDWAKQGVLLLNTVLTVEKDKPLSHKNKGWEIFTDFLIKKISEKENVVFVLWGLEAKNKKEIIKSNNFIIESSHPSPFSYNKGFKGSKPFSKINKILNNSKINW